MSAERSLSWPAPSQFDAPFLVAEGRTLSHGAAAGLAAVIGVGVRPGARELIAARPSVFCILSILACWSRGALAIVIDGREPDESRDLIAREFQASTRGIGDPSLATESRAIDLPLDSLAVALRTSGSSGAPKLAAHRLSSLVANARASNSRTAFGVGDRWLLSLSPHHIGGLSIVVRAMMSGGAVRIGHGPGGVADDLRDDSAITHVSLVATQLRRLLDDGSSAARLQRMKAVFLGGGPAPAAWRREAVERGIPLRATYGLTECASQVATGIASSSDEAGDAGLPLDGVEVRVADDSEIIVRGATVFAGYLDADGVRDARDAEGFFATGDLGRLDERGHLHIIGRKDAMFISGGENIHAEEIENVLREVPGITQACVVGIDDALWQTRPVAFVVGTFDARELERTLAARLPRFKWPDRVLAMPPDEAEKAKQSRARLVDLAANSSSVQLWSRPN